MTLRELLDQKNKSYDKIEYRIYCNIPYNKNVHPVSDLMLYNGKLWEDTLFGFCSYNVETKELKPLDGDSYNLDVQLINWEELSDRLVVRESPDEQIENFENYQAGYKDAEQKYKKIIKEIFEQIEGQADSDAYNDYQFGHNWGLAKAAQIVQSYL